MSEDIRFDLPQSAIPRHWYNVQADLPRSLPPVLHPGTHQPVGPDDLAPLFPMQLILQEVSQDRWIEIPEEVRENLQALAAHASAARAAAGAGSRYAGAYLLQV